MPPTGAWRSQNQFQHEGCGVRTLGLLIGKATLAGFSSVKAEMRGMCGGQPLLIEYIVNILIPYPNYGYWQRAADPQTRPTPRAPASHSRRHPALEDALAGAFDVLSHRGPHALHVARLDDLKKHDVVGLHPAQQPRQHQPSREIDRKRIGFASSKGEEQSLRLMLLIVVMNRREPIKQHHRGLDGRSLRGLGALSSCGAQSLL
jgi:hypothetical protein